MASFTTSEVLSTSSIETPPFSLIEYKGLFFRLLDELKLAATELSRDPQAFFKTIVSADTRDQKRRRLLWGGVVVAASVHVAFLVVVAIAGWHRFMAPVTPPDRPTISVTMVEPQPSPRTGSVPTPTPGTNKPNGDKDGRGGGGGQQDPRPAPHGTLPQSVPRPPIIAFNAPSAQNPALPMPFTTAGPETPPPPAPVGDPNSKGTEPSAGPGKGGGVGAGNGPGAGVGRGPGSGPGSGGRPGNGINGGDPGGGDPTDLLFSGQKPEGFIPFRWLYRPTPVTTPEAQENKVIGYVVLRATFNANGTVSDIEILQPVEYMTESAIDSLKRSRFKPATINGKPVTLRKVPIKVLVHY